MVAGEQDQRPEVRLGEEMALLLIIVDEREFKGVVLIDVTLVNKGKDDLPAREPCIVQGRKPIQEEKLA